MGELLRQTCGEIMSRLTTWSARDGVCQCIMELQGIEVSAASSQPETSLKNIKGRYMQIYLPPDRMAAVENLVAAGRFRSVDEAVAEGLRLLESAEQLREDIEKGIQQADRGELTDHDTVFARLKMPAASGQAGSS